MRTLALLALVFATTTAAAAPRPLAPFAVGEPEIIVVALDGGEPPAAGVRTRIEGKVTKVKRDREGMHFVSVGRKRFEIGLPPNVKLPVRRGDRIRAELWVDDRGKLHARVTDAKGAPLVFMNEVPDGWAMTIGERAADRPDRPPVYQHRIHLTAPSTPPTTFAGWLDGDVDGRRYIVYGEARVVDQAEARKLGAKIDWERSLFSGVVHVK